MTGRAVAQAVEQAVRDQLAATDQPLAALQAIAEELFSALENVAAAAASQQEAEALALVHHEFYEAFARVWEEYGASDALPSTHGAVPEGHWLAAWAARAAETAKPAGALGENGTGPH